MPLPAVSDCIGCTPQAFLRKELVALREATAETSGYGNYKEASCLLAAGSASHSLGESEVQCSTSVAPLRDASTRDAESARTNASRNGQFLTPSDIEDQDAYSTDKSACGRSGVLRLSLGLPRRDERDRANQNSPSATSTEVGKVSQLFSVQFFFELFGPVHNEGACTARIFTRVMGFQFANHMIQRSVVTKHPRTWKLVEMRERWRKHEAWQTFDASFVREQLICELECLVNAPELNAPSSTCEIAARGRPVKHVQLQLQANTFFCILLCHTKWYEIIFVTLECDKTWDAARHTDMGPEGREHLSAETVPVTAELPSYHKMRWHVNWSQWSWRARTFPEGSNLNGCLVSVVQMQSVLLQLLPGAPSLRPPSTHYVVLDQLATSSSLICKLLELAMLWLCC
ncbi:hypothetical protein AK812_SmicGene21301 [Symbiodinium microadriaticum]|uniref:Uncharacterized protein n=1 Tax=Symbiodinium microadriaticum TaxID=2951 RepID=A0A1Q9DMS4_SYMMI|nr:hypothetical protein AK812_SmicGene21301 [Symbiodinium microadriaticum]